MKKSNKIAPSNQHATQLQDIKSLTAPSNLPSLSKSSTNTGRHGIPKIISSSSGVSSISESDIYEAEKSLEENVHVIVRVRPISERELKLNSSQCTHIVGDNQITVTKYDDHHEGFTSFEKKRTFTFDRVFDKNATQQQVYEWTGKRVLSKCVLGYNGCIFAYGQTGSGKTYTMEGTNNDPGVMKQLSRDLFCFFDMKSDSIETFIRASYIEVYNDNLIDLMAKVQGNRQRDLKIREDKIKGIYVSGLTELPVACSEDVENIITRGTKYRIQGETKMNAVSSRSHAILTLFIDQQDKHDDKGFTLKESKLNLIDLAGSERAGQTGATGDRLKEGSKINQSLSALGNVINALVLQKPYIPYRGSKLTRLLQNSLGGNSVTMIIANMSPATVNFEESLSTLYFADRAKQIKNKVTIARDPKLARIAELMEEVARLKKRIKFLEQNQVMPDNSSEILAKYKELSKNIDKEYANVSTNTPPVKRRAMNTSTTPNASPQRSSSQKGHNSISSAEIHIGEGDMILEIDPSINEGKDATSSKTKCCACCIIL